MSLMNSSGALLVADFPILYIVRFPEMDNPINRVGRSDIAACHLVQKCGEDAIEDLETGAS